MRLSPSVLLGAAFCCAVVSGCGSRATLELGSAALDEGRYRNAARILERVARRDRTNPAAYERLGVAYWKSGQTDRSVEAFRQAAALVPADPRPLEFAARVLDEAGRLPEAAQALNEAYQRQPDSARVLTAMGVLRVHRGQDASAQAVLLEALRVSPDYAPALYNLGVLSRDRLGDQASARVHFERFMEVAAGSARAEDVRIALESMGAERGAMTTPAAPGGGGARPARSSPAAAGRPDRQSSDLLGLARRALDRGDVDEAMIRLRQAVESAPGSSDPLWELARLYDTRLHDAVQAGETYRRFVRLFPDDGRATMARERLNELSRTADHGQAAPAVAAARDRLTASRTLRLRKPLQRDPEAAAKALGCGIAQHHRGDLDRALYYYRLAVETDDSLVNGYYNLGLVYAASREPERAREAFLMALDLKPDFIDARYALAMAYRELKLDIKAIDHLREILKIDSNHANAHLGLALIYEKDPRRMELARQHMTRYMELAPDGEQAAHARSWLASHS